MSDDRETTGILAHAQTLLRGGNIGNALVVESGRIGTSIAVRAPDGRVHSWFVPVTVGNQLTSFFQFLPDLTLMRYSSFQRRDDSLEGCPFAESWTDPETIRRHAEKSARPGETAGVPFLTYDRAPSRLVWAVALKSPDGTTRTVFIAGQVVWEAPAADIGIDSYGGSQPR